jgi:hypothetical protein
VALSLARQGCTPREMADARALHGEGRR